MEKDIWCCMPLFGFPVFWQLLAKWRCFSRLTQILRYIGFPSTVLEKGVWKPTWNAVAFGLRPLCFDYYNLSSKSFMSLDQLGWASWMLLLFLQIFWNFLCKLGRLNKSKRHGERNNTILWATGVTGGDIAATGRKQLAIKQNFYFKELKLLNSVKPFPECKLQGWNTFTNGKSFNTLRHVAESTCWIMLRCRGQVRGQTFGPPLTIFPNLSVMSWPCSSWKGPTGGAFLMTAWVKTRIASRYRSIFVKTLWTFSTGIYLWITNTWQAITQSTPPQKKSRHPL